MPKAKLISTRIPSDRFQRMEFEGAFWSHVQIGDPNMCWNWTAGTSGTSGPNGYGCFRNLRAHKIALFLSKGEDAEGDIFVLHSCDNPLCCNPNHLRLGTHQDNMDDKTSRRRQSRKVTDDKVIEIRRRYDSGDTGAEIADKFDLDYSSVMGIIHGETAKFIPGIITYNGNTGKRNGQTKLTEDQVRLLRQRRIDGLTYTELSIEFSISRQQAHNIVSGKKWSHLK